MVACLTCGEKLRNCECIVRGDYEYGYAEGYRAGQEEMRAKVSELTEEVNACIEFLWVEMGWEYFRADLLCQDDQEYKRVSSQNAKKIKNFLVSRGWSCDQGGKAVRK